jgi:hypothetical protein
LLQLGYINKDKFIFPYILKKNVEGVKFLFHIADQDSHLWYNIKSGGYSWPELAFIRDNLIKKWNCNRVWLTSWDDSNHVI